MYNGIGLQSARGSGTNGYVQKNAAFIKRTKDKIEYKTEAQLAPPERKPNQELLEHELKRQIEIKCVEMEDLMASQGFTDDQIEEKVTKYREMLRKERLSNEGSYFKDVRGNILSSATHCKLAMNQEKNMALREALNISKDYVDGSCLSRLETEQSKKEKSVAAEKAETVKSASKPQEKENPKKIEAIEKKKSKKKEKESSSSSSSSESDSSSESSLSSSSSDTDTEKKLKSKKVKSQVQTIKKSNDILEEKEKVLKKPRDDDDYDETKNKRQHSERKEKNISPSSFREKVHRKSSRDEKYKRRSKSISPPSDKKNRRRSSNREADHKKRERYDSSSDDEIINEKHHHRHYSSESSNASDYAKKKYKQKSKVVKTNNKKRKHSSDSSEDDLLGIDNN